VVPGYQIHKARNNAKYVRERKKILKDSGILALEPKDENYQ
jgi:hypothetical protein